MLKIKFNRISSGLVKKLFDAGINNVSKFLNVTKEELLESKPCSIDSLGYLIKEEEDYIIMSADKDTHNEDDIFGRSQIIPKGTILKIQYLQEIP